jgi:hypothetical protein
MGEANSLEGLLNRLKEQQRREARGLTGLDDFTRIATETELPFDSSLELAVLTLVHHRYRGVPQWRIQQTYSFTCDGIFQRTFVESWSCGMPIRFTPEEAILIARHLSQQDYAEW